MTASGQNKPYDGTTAATVTCRTTASGIDLTAGQCGLCGRMSASADRQRRRYLDQRPRCGQRRDRCVEPIPAESARASHVPARFTGLLDPATGWMRCLIAGGRASLQSSAKCAEDWNGSAMHNAPSGAAAGLAALGPTDPGIGASSARPYLEGESTAANPANQNRVNNALGQALAN